MSEPLRSLIYRMADELDYYRQLLMDDRRETHALATEARVAIADELEGNTMIKPGELWKAIGGKTGPYDLGPEEIASILPTDLHRFAAAALRAAADCLTDPTSAHTLYAFAAELEGNAMIKPGELWRAIGGKTGPHDLGPEEIASILTLIADEVEGRGQIDYDRDPGETAEWLRAEAEAATKASKES
jgi:hypothetical protein